eukprot:jgi/Chrzof1/10452/UNPLg00379.t1
MSCIQRCLLCQRDYTRTCEWHVLGPTAGILARSSSNAATQNRSSSAHKALIGLATLPQNNVTARLATRSGTGSQCKRPPHLHQPNSCSSHMTWVYARCIPGVKQRSVVW